MKIELQLAQIEQDIKEQFEPEYSMSDYRVYSFKQIWPSLDLGFAKDQFEAYTAANTYVFIAIDEHIAYVYFDTHFAYKANPKNKNFKRDLENEEMAYVIDAEKYIKG